MKYEFKIIRYKSGLKIPLKQTGLFQEEQACLKKFNRDYNLISSSLDEIKWNSVRL